MVVRSDSCGYGAGVLWVDVPQGLQRSLPFLLAGGWLVALGVCTLSGICA